MTWSWDAFDDIGSDVTVDVMRTMGLFHGRVAWSKGSEDLSVELGFDEAQDDADFDAFMTELLELAQRRAAGS